MEICREADKMLLRVIGALESAVAGEEVVATRVPVHHTDGKNSDGTYRYKQVGTRVRLEYKSEGEE